MEEQCLNFKEEFEDGDLTSHKSLISSYFKCKSDFEIFKMELNTIN